MKTIYIYFPPQLRLSRDVIEDALDKLLEGKGEVTGGGTGEIWAPTLILKSLRGN